MLRCWNLQLVVVGIFSLVSPNAKKGPQSPTQGANAMRSSFAGWMLNVLMDGATNAIDTLE